MSKQFTRSMTPHTTGHDKPMGHMCVRSRIGEAGGTRRKA